MPELLLLRDVHQCPACRCNGRVSHFNACPNCGTILFLHDINFKEYENDGNLRTYWIYHKQNGWMHRDQIMCRLEAQERFPNIVTPEPNNKTTPEMVAKRGGKSKRFLRA